MTTGRESEALELRKTLVAHPIQPVTVTIKGIMNFFLLKIFGEDASLRQAQPS